MTDTKKGLQMLIRISSNGQLTIPKYIRDSLQLKSGDRFLARIADDKLVLERVTDEFESILETARDQAKQTGLKRGDVSKAVAKARSRT
jgi:AbrB family looped-hinge helix DNA binding protein